MTEQTKVLGIRLETKDKEYLQKYLNRGSAEALLKQIKRGEIELTLKGVIFPNVNTETGSVNTKTSKNDGNPVINDVNTDCDNCPYVTDLDMSKFDEVCDYKGIDRQKALDKCVQMLWR